MSSPKPSSAAPSVRRAILQEGEFFHNGITGEAATLYAQRAESFGLAIALGKILKARGLGSIGVAVTFLEKDPAWAFTSVGFTPKGEAGKLTHGEGTGVLVGVEGASLLARWPSVENMDEGTYRTFWLPIDNRVPLWRKLGPYFPQTAWQAEADAVAEKLFSAHRDTFSAHWIALGGAG